jgi:PAS domain S-box-containing protein
VAPTGVEQDFSPTDIIVTKTDLKGKIVYANKVCVQICGYPENELVGAPHSLLRHPDMPRAIFKLLWDTIAQGTEMFAFVVNLCGDGSHYWVLAHVTASFDAQGKHVGYHSSRRWISPTIRREVADLYRHIRAVEAAHHNSRDAAEAGVKALNEYFAANGTDYSTWLWSIAAKDIDTTRSEKEFQRAA